MLVGDYALPKCGVFNVFWQMEGCYKGSVNAKGVAPIRNTEYENHAKNN